jgi:hypothetical protein
MNKKGENFTRLKRWLVGLSGLAMLIASIILSKEGVGFKGDVAWIGLTIAVSLTCAEFMFNSNFEEMNWTTLVLGIGAYLYSINTNINGFYSFQNLDGNLFSNFDVKSFFGGIFMDVYPELAIAWSLKESKVGDLLGNIIKSWANPDKMTESQLQSNNQTSHENGARQQNTPHQSQRQQGVPEHSQNQNPMRTQGVPQSLPRRDGVPSGQNLPVGMGGGAGGRQPIPQMRQQPLPSGGREPTYHPVSNGTEQSRYEA